MIAWGVVFSDVLPFAKKAWFLQVIELWKAGRV